MGSVEGFESSVDWENYNLLTSALWFVQNSQSVGVRATYTYEKFSGTVIFGDGFDTNVWNYLQLLASYDFNDNNSVTFTGDQSRHYGSRCALLWQRDHAVSLDHRGIGGCRESR